MLTKAAMAPDAPPIRPWSRNSPFPAKTAKCFGSVWAAVRWRFPKFYHQRRSWRDPSVSSGTGTGKKTQR